MNEENIEESSRNILIEQYKLYVEMADRVSNRRNNSNIFYVSLLSSILALFMFIIEHKIIPDFSIFNFFLLLIGMISVSLSITWFFNIRSYEQLNSVKFDIIHNMEKELPYQCYKKEWDLIKGEEGDKKKKYLRVTKIEQSVPFIFIILYTSLLIYSIINLIPIIYNFITIFSIGMGIGIFFGIFILKVLQKIKNRIKKK
ncbi:MAG: RipA family octameric membrane protein [Promethearchaeota archaeon]